MVFITATVGPRWLEEGYDEVEWSSEDTKVATVDQNGIITGVKEGETVVKVTTVYTDEEGNHLTAEVKVTVTKRGGRNDEEDPEDSAVDESSEDASVVDASTDETVDEADEDSSEEVFFDITNEETVEAAVEATSETSVEDSEASAEAASEEATEGGENDD